MQDLLDDIKTLAAMIFGSLAIIIGSVSAAWPLITGTYMRPQAPQCIADPQTDAEIAACGGDVEA